MKQIVVITDGKSNVGGDPVMAANEAKRNNISISTIGIIEKDIRDEGCIEEIQNIANNGKGECQLTYIEDLRLTLQMVTQKTMNKTISTVVNEQLKEIIGSELDEIRPNQRNKFIEYIENLSDEIKLRCCILLDSSGSMKSKLGVAKESILDLMHTIKSRKGKSEIAIIVFPGKNGQMNETIQGFTNEIHRINKSLKDIKANGTTPTAPAIYKAIRLFDNNAQKPEEIIEEETPLFEDNIV